MSTAGLVPSMLLAESAGLHELLGEKLTVDSPNAVAKALRVVAGMLTGPDSIDDLDALRHGGMPRSFAVRAPSRLGTFLRSFTHGHVQQLGRGVVAGLTDRCLGCWQAATRAARRGPCRAPAITGVEPRRDLGVEPRTRV